mmetsp:Transcript_20291/g.29460  ORF Transcript_20291/g.29460 Transcript_20291/m.29460 type:complete len:506 (-) Transcript_20291:111-1628(-)
MKSGRVFATRLSIWTRSVYGMSRIRDAGSSSVFSSFQCSRRWLSMSVQKLPPPQEITTTEEVEEADTRVASFMTPKEIVLELDRHIVGQADAKRAMSIALRNRWRRHQLPITLREEVLPKNILMIGPTGVGKTEIARRLAKLVDAPFVKVEATKYTEVGFHGRDVDQIIRDLVENAIQLVKQRQRRMMKEQIRKVVEDKILDELTGLEARSQTRESFRSLLRKGALEEREIEVEEPARSKHNVVQIGDMGPERMNDILSRVDKFFTVQRSGSQKRRMTVREARAVIEDVESEKILTDESITKKAIDATEQDGIVFIDEIDKICTPSNYRHGADASSEGVQRDLLPIVEGSTISTKHGNVNTDHILFVASGAFHSAKPSDLMAELQGRLPIRVELKGLTEADMYRILVVPENNLVRQHVELLKTEGVNMHITESALREIAAVAAELNMTVENIGARRLHTVLERILEDVSYNAPDLKGETITIDAVSVRGALGDMLLKTDLSKYVL